MRFGYWMPVFGGWLRNIPDEGMEASWDYVKRLTQRSEETGWDLSLIAELNLNDIKGVDQPALDAWSTAAALAAVTSSIELMVAVRPNFHQPALFAKEAANIDNISGGRLALNVVSSWWADEATQYGLQFDQHDDRYARTTEWLQVVDGLWTQDRFSFDGQRYRLDSAICEPKPVRKPRPTIYAGGESEAAKTMITTLCDAYVMHGDPVDAIRRVRDEHRGNIYVHGSRQLAQTLLEYDLVDQLNLMVFPVVLGTGKRIFGETGNQKKLRLVDSKVVGDGVAILIYEPAQGDTA